MAGVAFSRGGVCLMAELNRPQVLNSINLSMLIALGEELTNYKKHQPQDLELLVLTGAGEKAFCAGGDVKELAMAARKGDHQLGVDFFRTHLMVDYLLGSLATGRGRPDTPRLTQVSIMDRITMGGGVGLCMHGPFRVATERTIFAMPEVGIGFFPDVGSSHFLNHLHSSVGLLLGLTGRPIHGIQTLLCGAATHYVPSSSIPRLVAGLQELPREVARDLTRVDDFLSTFMVAGASNAGLTNSALPGNHVHAMAHGDEEVLRLVEEYHAIVRVAETHFAGKGSVADVAASLASATEDTSLCSSTLKALLSASPFSVSIAHEQLNRGRSLSFEEALAMEFRLAARFTAADSDFHEGVRCRLLDRGATPRYRFSSIADVPTADVLAWFEPLASCEELDVRGEIAFARARSKL